MWNLSLEETVSRVHLCPEVFLRKGFQFFQFVSPPDFVPEEQHTRDCSGRGESLEMVLKLSLLKEDLETMECK